MNNFATIFRQIELKVQLWTMSGIEEMLQRIYDMQIKQMRAIEKIDSRLSKLEQLHENVSESNGAVFRSPAPSTNKNKDSASLWPPSPMMQDDFFEHILNINQRLSKVEGKRTCPPLSQKVYVDNSTSPSRKERKVNGGKMEEHKSLVSTEKAKNKNTGLKSSSQKESLKAIRGERSLKHLGNEEREAKIAALLSQAPPPPPPEPPVLKTNNDSKQADLKRKLQLLKMIKRRRSSGTR